MPEYTIEIIDERSTLEIVDERPTIEISAVGIQGAPGKGFIVSDTPPDSPEVNDVWVKPNV